MFLYINVGARKSCDMSNFCGWTVRFTALLQRSAFEVKVMSDNSKVLKQRQLHREATQRKQKLREIGEMLCDGTFACRLECKRHSAI